MVKKIIRGYKNLLLGAGKLLALLAVCTAAGALVVFPLWKFATLSPEAYTVFILALVALALAFAAVRRIRRHGMGQFARSLLKFAVAAGGLSACVLLVLSGRRLLALPALLVFALLYGLVAFKK